jgi:hypothetical protein
MFGALIALGITFGHRWREQHAPVATKPHATASTAPQVVSPAPTTQTAQDAWLGRRALEFDKCATLHGTPTLGFGMRVVCLDSHAVKFIGEEHPPY